MKQGQGGRDLFAEGDLPRMGGSHDDDNSIFGGYRPASAQFSG